ncbi:putative Zn peptidase [Leptolyngbya sp. PCC 7375]|nr:putative Zn peptidase [Leptolyngbya sp. PCC 7375]
MRRPSTPGFIGEKLREAREARGLNGTALADLIGVSRQSVSKYENGDQNPSPEVLERIAEILRVPLDYFLVVRKRSVNHQKAIFYRSMAAATLTERLRAERRYLWLQDIVAYLISLVDFPKPNIPNLNIPENPELITSEVIENAAYELRKYWHLGIGPISNIVWLLENNGIIVSCYSLEAATLDGFSQYQYDRPYIILGSDKGSAARSRFSAGHELGHLVLHRNLTVEDIKKPKILKLIESQANRFSGAFHVPEQAFAEDFLSIDLDYFKLKKKKWKLSIAFFLQRAKDLGFVDDKQYSLLRRYYSRKGWRKFEPLDEELEVEKPQLLREAFELIIENDVCSRSDILHRLKLNPDDIEAICGLPPRYLRPAEVLDLPMRPSLKIKHEPSEPAQVININLFRD